MTNSIVYQGPHHLYLRTANNKKLELQKADNHEGKNMETNHMKSPVENQLARKHRPTKDIELRHLT